MKDLVELALGTFSVMRVLHIGRSGGRRSLLIPSLEAERQGWVIRLDDQAV